MPRKSIPRNCAYCSVPFLADPHEVKRGGARFCSKSCARRKPRVKRTCGTCGAEFRAPRDFATTKYCSRPCQLARNRSRRPLAERFWEKVARTDDLLSCWLWKGSTNKAGYGHLGAGGRSGTLDAHRVSWELHFGPVPDGMCVLHDCDTPACVRPDHLFLGSHEENTKDMVAKRRAGWQTHPERWSARM